MPTNRRRTARHSNLNPEAVAWARSEDGRRFFEDEAWARTKVYTFHGTLGLKPWEMDIFSAWYYPPTVVDLDYCTTTPKVRALLEELHAIYKEAHK